MMSLRRLNGLRLSSRRSFGADFPEFSGKVYHKNQLGYETHRDQYAYSSHGSEGEMEPVAIIYPVSPKADDDVRLAVNYARNKGIAVALRTGGHQYSGASSTFGPNIQLDLSEAYPEFEWDEGLLKVGVSHKLDTMNKKLGEQGLFVPHGQCSTVHVGGHAQTGGYGQLGRAFGLFGDFIQRIRLITADGKTHEIPRGTSDPKEADLFFAVLGGSPGNFGVLTHVYLQPLRDSDHPNSRGLKIIAPYWSQAWAGIPNTAVLEKLLNVMAEMAADNEVPPDFDFCISFVSDLLGTARRYFRSRESFEEFKEAVEAELVKEFQHKSWPNLPNPGVIVLYVQWANLGGKDQQYDPGFFNKIKAAFDGVFYWPTVNDSRPKPMSDLTKEWIFPDPREFAEPYNKRTYVTKSTTVNQGSWAKYTASRINEIEDHPQPRPCKLAVQIQHYGGTHSRFRNNDAEKLTAYSWRDSSIVHVFDCFYTLGNKKDADQWQAENDKGLKGPRGCLSTEDRRVFWASYHETLEEKNLAKAWPFYHESQEKYDRLRAIKKAVDPSGVFTPNKFSVQVDVSDV